MERSKVLKLVQASIASARREFSDGARAARTNLPNCGLPAQGATRPGKG